MYTAKSVEGFREGDLVEFAGEMNRISAIFENTVTFEKKFSADPVDTAIVPKKVLYSVEMDVTIRCDGDAETFSGVTLNPTSPAYLGRKLSGSRLVAAAVEPSDALDNPVSVILGKGVLSGTISFTGGSDGTMEAVNAGVFIGEDNGPGQRTGIQAFLENDVASIIAVPGVTIPEVVVALISHCENMKNRFAVLDIPQELRKTNDIIEYRNMVDSTYAAMYHPWIQVYDRVAKKPAFIPPSGAVMGVYSRTDVSRGVHKAPGQRDDRLHRPFRQLYHRRAGYPQSRGRQPDPRAAGPGHPHLGRPYRQQQQRVQVRQRAPSVHFCGAVDPRFHELGGVRAQQFLAVGACADDGFLVPRVALPRRYAGGRDAGRGLLCEHRNVDHEPGRYHERPPDLRDRNRAEPSGRVRHLPCDAVHRRSGRRGCRRIMSAETPAPAGSGQRGTVLDPT